MAEFRVGFTINPKAEPYIRWLEENRPSLQLTRVFSARDQRPHIVITVDAPDLDDAAQKAVQAWDEARASIRLPAIYASEAAPIARTAAWKVSEEPPVGYDIEAKRWRVLLSMEGGWKDRAPDVENLNSRINNVAPDLIQLAPNQYPAAGPVHYDFEAPATLAPEQLKEIVDAAMRGWAEGRTVTAKILDPSQGNKIVAQ